MTTQEKQNQYIMGTYGRFPVVLEQGKQESCQDETGKQYIDFGSGIGTNSLGYCNEAWVNAVCKQAQTLQHTSNLYYTKAQADFAEALCKATGYHDLFFCNSGAEANECAIKLARKYSFDKYGKGRHKILTLVNSFHGRTMATLSATGQDVFHNYFFPFLEGFDYVVANDIADLDAKIDDTVCAILIEYVQGEGGVMALEQDFVDAIYDRCAKRDILVMTDEIRGTEAEKNPESLNIRVFPGADGSFRLYEDDNETCAYENGACVFTEMDYKEKDQGVFTIHPAQGKTELIPAKRAYTVEFCNFAKTGTDTVKVLVNGAETEAAVKYEEKLQKICVEVEADTAAEVQIILAGEVADNQTKERVFDFLNQAEIGFVLKDRLYQLITAGKKLPVLLSELQSMELDKDLYGALMEILTA